MSFVTRRSTQIADRVAETMSDHGVSPKNAAQAAGIGEHDLELQLTGVLPLEVRVLAAVGGLSRVPITHFTEGVT